MLRECREWPRIPCWWGCKMLWLVLKNTWAVSQTNKKYAMITELTNCTPGDLSQQTENLCSHTKPVIPEYLQQLYL